MDTKRKDGMGLLDVPIHDRTTNRGQTRNFATQSPKFCNSMGIKSRLRPIKLGYGSTKLLAADGTRTTIQTMETYAHLHL